MKPAVSVCFCGEPEDGSHDNHDFRAMSVRPTLLLVEDDRHVARALVRLAELDGWAVTHAATVTQALALLGSPATAPDACVTDWHLLGETSMPVISACRERRIPCTVFTGSRPPVVPYLEKTDTKGLRSWLREAHGAVLGVERAAEAVES